jgi:hypothetical protein
MRSTDTSTEVPEAGTIDLQLEVSLTTSEPGFGQRLELIAPRCRRQRGLPPRRWEPLFRTRTRTRTRSLAPTSPMTRLPGREWDD